MQTKTTFKHIEAVLAISRKAQKKTSKQQSEDYWTDIDIDYMCIHSVIEKFTKFRREIQRLHIHSVSHQSPTNDLAPLFCPIADASFHRDDVSTFPSR